MALNSTLKRNPRGGGGQNAEKEAGERPTVSVGMTSLCTAAVFVNQGQGCLLESFSGRKGSGESKKGKTKGES